MNAEPELAGRITASDRPFSWIVAPTVVDIALAVAALLFGACSLFYPFGHDQGVHYYVGREWLQHGALPYRDSFDYKTPGIYLLYAALIAIFGEGQWAIRLAELSCVVWLGHLCARITTAKPPPGFVGRSVFLTSVAYYGFFNFWDTAQCELWSVTLAFASLLFCLRSEVRLRSVAIAGLLGSSAVLMKPSVVGIVAVSLAVLIGRLPRKGSSVATYLAAFFAAATALPAAVLIYFVAKGGGPSVLEMIAADRAYVLETRTIRTALDLWRASLYLFTSFNPYATIILAVLSYRAFVAWVDKSYTPLRSFSLATVTAIAAYVGVAVQLKFYRYHAVLLVGPAVLFAGAITKDLQARARLAESKMAILASVFVVMLFPLAGGPAITWWRANADALALLDGDLTRDAFNHKFSIPALAYDYGDSEAAGLWLREHTKPDEVIAVRAFLPEVYAVAQRRFSGRFFWTVALTDPARTYKRAEWLEQDRRQLAEASPQFVVVIANPLAAPEGSQYFEPQGYRRVASFGRLIILEKAGGA